MSTERTPPEVLDMGSWLLRNALPRYVEGSSIYGDPDGRGDSAYWLQHAVEETMDLAFYLRQVQKRLKPGPDGRLRIYVAGPYTAPTHEQVAANIAAARDAGVALLRMGHRPLIPHTMTAHWDEIYPDVTWGTYIEWLCDLLGGCHAILMLPGWEESRGSCIEHNVAEAMRKGVFLSMGDVPPVLAPMILARESPHSRSPTPAQLAEIDETE